MFLILIFVGPASSQDDEAQYWVYNTKSLSFLETLTYCCYVLVFGLTIYNFHLKYYLLFEFYYN